MVIVSYLAHYDTLLQNATDIITKCDSYFITKCGKSLQNVSVFLLQNVTVLLQNASYSRNETWRLVSRTRQLEKRPYPDVFQEEYIYFSMAQDFRLPHMTY